MSQGTDEPLEAHLKAHGARWRCQAGDALGIQPLYKIRLLRLMDSAFPHDTLLHPVADGGVGFGP